ncbi:MAG: hypothetical protein HKP48_05600 [Winogradskyella sp.]|uniref:glycosyl-4,4'-diaponeurosporenoate acyltransferase CrtO family protein n=1 Tax=Winogradskyella sp. TaxID=1883156 RepID=UPI00184891C3|nr:hypothetical protein [Winogradskyella sp.]MBT8245429.1 hypothetical protein [Winogradskyella sp.]NNK22772.1 hypothetical protein [Winogradskyella sp.]
MNNFIKTSLWPIATLWVSFLAIYGFLQVEKRFTVNSFLFAFDLHFVLMFWYAITLPWLKLKYDSSYYNIKPYENNGKVYTYFGVNVFRWFLRFMGWNRISDKSNGRVLKNIERLKKREKHTREAEFANALLFVHFLGIAFCFMTSHNMFWLLILNTILHLVPVFIQRDNSPRFLKLISRFEATQNHG